MGRRPLKTVPAGQPPPIFFAMRCNPNGVQFEPSTWPMPNPEVEQRVNPERRQEPKHFSKSERVWSAILTARTHRVAGTPTWWFLRRQPSNKRAGFSGMDGYFN